jgi:hypothetical protein
MRRVSGGNGGFDECFDVFEFPMSAPASHTPAFTLD